MIHLVSSEALAALVCLLFIAAAAAAHLLRWSWWCGMTELDTLIAIASCCFACRGMAAGRRCKWPRDVDFTSRVAIVTGASSGVGFGVAQELAQHGWTVILAGRDLMRLLGAKRAILTRRPQGRVVVLGAVDLSDLSSVREFAACVVEQKQKFPVALLVNAAGVLRRHLHRCEGTGMEEMIATNVVGPMLLTQLLLPLLDETAERSGVSSRIINVASSCHTFLGVWQRCTPIDMLTALHPAPTAGGDEDGSNNNKDDKNNSGSGNSKDATQEGHPQPAVKDFTFADFVGYYGLSKLCVVWWTTVLARRLSLRFFHTGNCHQLRVFVACCHPGVITTHLYRDLLPWPVLDHIVYYPSLLIGKTWTEGAQAVLKACVEPDNMVHGGYYLCSGEYGPSSGVNCLSKYAMNMEMALQFCAWAEVQIEQQKNLPKQQKAVDAAATAHPKRIMTVKIARQS
ncbi:putative short-chain dehydrogenase [Trypanosoma grayi]|uniref:putative short-chain dehydrogenase n=1 Tax=Trypanosoma grayi TaxID=71804 RepID=UPI0004F48411|nr:putative short-chain dehydrogenase [Trypanosoma grayi]KEG10695.1 putative short-chain dehydrogenase [Trypanosoma grayi]